MDANVTSISCSAINSLSGDNFCVRGLLLVDLPKTSCLKQSSEAYIALSTYPKVYYFQHRSPRKSAGVPVSVLGIISFFSKQTL